jgi:hypothetical protein
MSDFPEEAEYSYTPSSYDDLEQKIDDFESKLYDIENRMLTWNKLFWAFIGCVIFFAIVEYFTK